MTAPASVADELTRLHREVERLNAELVRTQHNLGTAIVDADVAERKLLMVMTVVDALRDTVAVGEARNPLPPLIHARVVLDAFDVALAAVEVTG